MIQTLALRLPSLISLNTRPFFCPSTRLRCSSSLRILKMSASSATAADQRDIKGQLDAIARETSKYAKVEPTRRPLHYVFKVADRTATIKFYRDILGMKVLRHEEFEEGCKASCNGPYDGKWSKTMVGYGPEDDHFVLELTYNYGIKHYCLGNDFQSISVCSEAAVESVTKHSWPSTKGSKEETVVEAPGGYAFHLFSGVHGTQKDSVSKVTLSVSDLVKSLGFWCTVLHMRLASYSENSAILKFGEDKAHLELVQISEPIDRAEAFGRTAFSCPRTELSGIEKAAREAGHTILTPLVSLDTPGKATVEVVILADPDGHEVCFVGDEAFRQLSVVDPKADQLINEAIEADKSDEWFAKRAQKKI